MKRFTVSFYEKNAEKMSKDINDYSLENNCNIISITQLDSLNHSWVVLVLFEKL